VRQQGGEMTQKQAGNFPTFLEQAVEDAAQLLLGCMLKCDIDTATVRVRIVETEAYDQADEASHTFRGQTLRNATMFGPPGHLYVYFTYGMHYCSNIVAGPVGYGAGVLIRAVEPVDGADILEQRRGVAGVNATNGPAKLTQALGINRAMDGHDLRNQPLQLITSSLNPGESIATSPRIGIAKARTVHRRYYIAGNDYVSR